MKSFLDLPAEIRNNIYQLVSDSILSPGTSILCQRKWHPGFVIRRNQYDHAHLPAIMATCRQIRAEFLSQELPKYEVEFYNN